MVDKEHESETLGVLLIGFNPVVREGLQAILTKDEKIEVIGDVPDEHQALLQLKEASDQGRPIHIVLTETRTSTLDGIQATRLIKEQFAAIIDTMNNMRNANEGGESKRMFSVAITEAQTAQMWAVKAATWKH